MTERSERTTSTDLLTLGRRVRHFRTGAGLTLEDLAERTGVDTSQLSRIENGLREPRLSLLDAVAGALGVPVATLLASTPPTRRAGLEIELDRAQRDPFYPTLGLPPVRPVGTERV